MNHLNGVFSFGTVYAGLLPQTVPAVDSCHTYCRMMNHLYRLRLGFVALACATAMARPTPPPSAGLPTVRVIAVDPTAVEGGSTGLFTFVRDGAATNDLSLQVTYTGSATNGVDYALLTNVVTIPAGQRAVDLVVQPVSKLPNGHDRSVKAHLLPTDTYTLGSPKSATVTIVENGYHVFPPTVSITSPTNGTTIAGATVPLIADVEDASAIVSRVLFYSGDHRLVELTNPPFQWTWTNVPAGGHTLRAWAEDSLGNWTVSDPVTVTLTNTVPTVSLVEPTNHTKIHGPGPITLSAQASNADSPIVEVDFLANSHLLGSVTHINSAGFYTLVLTNFGVGKFEIKARAIDQLGRESTSANVELDVTNAPPTVILTSPTAGTVVGASNVITLSATAADSDDAVAKVVFVLDSHVVGSVTNPPYSWTLTNLPPGQYKAFARVFDTVGLSTWSDSSKFAVTNIPPTIALTAPADHSIFNAGATVQLQASPSVADGAVKRVSFLVNGHTVGSLTSAPFSFNWTNVKPGKYTLRAVVHTSYGVEADSAPVSVTVLR